jgi:uncharacterized protein (TIGR03086 family)
MDVVATMERVVDETSKIVEGITPDQLGNPTPCTDWSVRDIVNHITGGSIMFAECVEQGDVPDERLGQLMAGDNLGDDFKGAWAQAARRAKETFRQPGAMEKTVKLPFGVMPAEIALNIAIFDVTTHACDLAKATGQKVEDEELLETALATGKQLISESFRDGVMFGPEAEPASDATSDRLLAFAGRKIS